ncbi:MAG: hypothetical protein AAGI07_13470 [Bacteroidota bacterium]
MLRLDAKGEEVSIRIHTDVKEPYLYLFIHNRQHILKVETLKVENNKATFNIAQTDFGTGINHITLFNSSGKPVAERLYFCYPEETTALSINMSQKRFSSREKVAFSLSSSENESTQLSMAVFHNDPFKIDNQPDIRSYLLLLSDLKGYIEMPQYYFSEKSENVILAMDNLMLTQGWRRFNWDNVFNKSSNTNLLIPEYEGQLVETFVYDKETGFPIEWAECYLSFPGKDFRFFALRTDRKGYTKFVTRKIEGQRRAFLIGKTNDEKTLAFKILSPYSEKYSENILPFFSLSEKYRAELEVRSLSMQSQNIYLEDNIHKLTQKVFDTIPFYGEPDVSYLLDDYTRFPTMEEVMREYVPKVAVRKSKGKFRFKVFDEMTEEFSKTEPLILLDGMPILDADEVMKFDPFKIKSLEVVSRRFIMNWVNFRGIVSYKTYDGDYTWKTPNPDALALNFEGLQLERTFYSPAYETQKQQASRLPDFRTLLHWEPNITLTGKQKQNISFYTSDRKGNYTGVIQGITSEGVPIYQTFELTVNEKEN